MAFGNQLGVSFREELKAVDLFENCLGDIVLEMNSADVAALFEEKENGGEAERLNFRKVADVNHEKVFTYQNVTVTMEEALNAWKSKLEKVFPTKAEKGTEPIESRLFKAEHVYVCRNKKANPTGFIPVFPGTNCEYDSAKAFKAAGAEVITRVFKNQSDNCTSMDIAT